MESAASPLGLLVIRERKKRSKERGRESKREIKETVQVEISYVGCPPYPVLW
jgi:coenzyme F420-reducing hydrogenase gamma subunit